MKEVKKKILTEKEQKVAIDFFGRIDIRNTAVPEGFFNNIMEKYELMTDPFTGLSCTPKEYASNRL